MTLYNREGLPMTPLDLDNLLGRMPKYDNSYATAMATVAPSKAMYAFLGGRSCAPDHAVALTTALMTADPNLTPTQCVSIALELLDAPDPDTVAALASAVPTEDMLQSLDARNAVTEERETRPDGSRVYRLVTEWMPDE